MFGRKLGGGFAGLGRSGGLGLGGVSVADVARQAAKAAGAEVKGKTAAGTRLAEALDKPERQAGRPATPRA